MITSQEHLIDPLIKIIKDRESLYFEVLSFTNKNIQSSSNDFDQIYIFSKYLKNVDVSETELRKSQDSFIQQFMGKSHEENMKNLSNKKLAKSSKQMIRLIARVQQILQESVETVRKSLFNENGKVSQQFQKLQRQNRKAIKKNEFQIFNFINSVIDFSKIKFKIQIEKLEKYLKKLEVGEHINLRDMYLVNEKSDMSASQDQKMKKNKNLTHRKLIKNEYLEENLDSPQKKPSIKKGSTSVRPKRNLNTRNMRRDESVGSDKVKEQKPEKNVVANKLYKYYALMEVNKKQFLEDYIFEKQAEEQQRKKLLNNLIQKNKTNGEQISTFYKKSEGLSFQTYTLPNPSSDENHSAEIKRNESSASKASNKTSFIISMRKPSYTFESSTDKSDIQFFKNQIPISRTSKNITQKKAGQSNTPRKKNPSKRIFVSKPPMLFEDQFLPRPAPIQNKWIQPPLTGRDRTKNSENLRLKKRNNPNPLNNSCLPQSFNFTQYPV